MHRNLTRSALLAGVLLIGPAPTLAQIVDSAATARAVAPLQAEARRVGRWADDLSLAREPLAYREGLNFEFLLEELRLHLAQLDTATMMLMLSPRLTHLLRARDLSDAVSRDLAQVGDEFRVCRTCAASSRQALATIADTAGAAARRWWKLTPRIEAELSAAVERADRLGASPPRPRRP